MMGIAFQSVILIAVFFLMRRGGSDASLANFMR